MASQAEVSELLARMMASWAAADHAGVASCFTPDARFIAFDGSAFEGASAIGRFHQESFAGPCKDTEILIELAGTRALAENVILASTQSEIRPRGTEARPTGPSVQTLVIVIRDGKPLITSLQNTRHRPITSVAPALIWRQFDEAWARQV